MLENARAELICDSSDCGTATSVFVSRANTAMMRCIWSGSDDAEENLMRNERSMTIRGADLYLSAAGQLVQAILSIVPALWRANKLHSVETSPTCHPCSGYHPRSRHECLPFVQCL